MTTLAGVVNDLRRLPPNKLKRAAEFVRTLKKRDTAHRIAVLKATAGSLTESEVDAFAKAIENGCERIESSGW